MRRISICVNCLNCVFGSKDVDVDVDVEEAEALSSTRIGKGKYGENKIKAFGEKEGGKNKYTNMVKRRKCHGDT